MPSDADVFGQKPLPLLCAENAVVVISTINAIELAAYVTTLAQEWSKTGPHFTPDVIREANRVTLRGIYACAGQYRDRFVSVGDHVPPSWKKAPELVTAMCDFANQIHHPIVAAAYILWRTTWIHPFYDGNGRVAREMCYLAFLAGSGLIELPGSPTISELIDRKYETEYIRGLREADTGWDDDVEPNSDKLERLLSSLVSLLSQLVVEQSETGI
jgi:Fic family protein